MSQLSNQWISQNDKLESEEFKLLLKQILLGSIQESRISDTESSPVIHKSDFCFRLEKLNKMEVKGLKNSHWLR